MSRLAAFRDSDALVAGDLDEYAPTLEAAWARQVKRMARVAVGNVARHQPVVAAGSILDAARTNWSPQTGIVAGAGERPDWSMPNEDEVLHVPTEAAAAKRAMEKQFAAMHRILVNLGASAGLSFDVRNRIVDEVLAARGQHITKITETIRSEIMTQLRAAYADGESLPKASRRVATVLGDRSIVRARVIAATELAGAKNGASVRLASVIDGTSLNDDGSVRRDTLGHDPVRIWKVWYATKDNRTRPTHARADGQQVAMTETFSVGDARLQYPGDPSGTGDEIIKCRCTMTYTESPP